MALKFAMLRCNEFFYTFIQMSLNYVLKNVLSSHTSSLIVNNNLKHFLRSFLMTKIRISNNVDPSQRCKLQTYVRITVISHNFYRYFPVNFAETPTYATFT